jgi:hypothetical protein
MRSITFPLFGCLILALSSSAQQPTPAQIVVQAAAASNTPLPARPVAADSNASIQSAIKTLEQTIAANAELLKKQDEMLSKLDDVKKAADQLRIFARRTGG